MLKYHTDLRKIVKQYFSDANVSFMFTVYHAVYNNFCNIKNVTTVNILCNIINLSVYSIAVMLFTS